MAVRTEVSTTLYDKVLRISITRTKIIDIEFENWIENWPRWVKYVFHVFLGNNILILFYQTQGTGTELYQIIKHYWILLRENIANRL